MPWFVAALLAAAAIGAEPADLPRMSPEAYAAMVARGDALIEEQVEAIKRQRAVTTSQVKAQRAEVAALEQRLGKVWPDLSFEVGSTGRLDAALVVVQVVGPASALVEDLNVRGRLLWVDGVPTSTLVDGQAFVRPEGGLYEIDSTKTYPTAGGATRTVLHVRAVAPPATQP